MPQIPTAPLDWDHQFLLLIGKMSHDIALYKNVTLAKYQTVIAAGCYLGVRPAYYIMIS